MLRGFFVVLIISSVYSELQLDCKKLYKIIFFVTHIFPPLSQNPISVGTCQIPWASMCNSYTPWIIYLLVASGQAKASSPGLPLLLIVAAVMLLPTTEVGGTTLTN